MGKQKKPEDPAQKARSSALRLLARREHSRLELVLKLRQRGIEPGLIEEVLDEYEHEGWLSDDRFADVYARQRMDLGYGPLRIQAELQQRGIRFLPEALKEVDDASGVRTAVRLRERKFGLADIRDDWPEKARQARFLGQRGFSAEQVEQALDCTAPDTLVD